MTRKRKLLNIKGRCRICLVDSECVTNLFDEVLQPKLNDLSKCTSIQIKDEHGLPNIICHICLYKLDLWNEFKEQFIRSNQMLLSQLELVEISDNEELQSKETYVALQQSGEDSLSDSFNKKKQKTNVPSSITLESTNTDNLTELTILKDMYISEDEVTSSKDSSQRAQDKNDKEQKNKDKSQLKPILATVKVKPLIGKRNKMKTRRASTKRWVARQKAKLAARGGRVSDTDSLASDDVKLSPMQKAQAKTNIDKAAEKQTNRLARVLKNLEFNMTDKYSINHDKIDFIMLDSDTDTRKTRSLKDINSDVSLTEKKNASPKDLAKNDKFSENLKEKENSPASSQKIVKEKSTKKDEINNSKDNTPCSVKSELDMGGTTYIVTSTLILGEPQYLNKTNLNTLSENLKNGNIEQYSQEKNTDIIDAVQLRRVNPVPRDTHDKNYMERCLNIEIEGKEVESLKRMQSEVAGFVENEMKHKLFGIGKNMKSELNNRSKSSYQTLDQQLKNVIEKAIKKNFETSLMQSCDIDFMAYIRQSKTVSPAFVREAMNSNKYQPKLVLKRLDIAKENKLRNINNLHTVVKRTVKKKLSGPFSVVSRKRKIVRPIRYKDYNTSALDSDSYNSHDNSETSASGGNTTRKSQERKEEINATKRTEELITIEIGSSPIKNEHNTTTQENVLVTSLNGENYAGEKAVGNCAESVTQVHPHKSEAVIVPRQNKCKMMRCKRCHEIVEARFVKAHVCKSTKQLNHKCYVCNSMFRTEKLLVHHLESHDQSEFNIENITKGESQLTNSNRSENDKESVHQRSETNKSLKENNSILKLDNSRIEMNNVHLEKETTEVEPNITDGVGETKQYTCFVCDKIFTDAEETKDHLQEHCDEVSENERSPGKEYQCAICGNSLESEEALETHVEKHLFDEGDDNPNLINIPNEDDQLTEEPYRCVECTETFNSEMLLEMHMQAHEEEVAIAEWEKQGIRTYEYHCLICNELFETEEDLTEHLDTHDENVQVCQLCEKPCQTLKDLEIHVSTTH